MKYVRIDNGAKYVKVVLLGPIFNNANGPTWLPSTITFCLTFACVAQIGGCLQIAQIFSKEACEIGYAVTMWSTCVRTFGGPVL